MFCWEQLFFAFGFFWKYGATEPFYHDVGLVKYLCFPVFRPNRILRQTVNDINRSNTFICKHVVKKGILRVCKRARPHKTQLHGKFVTASRRWWRETRKKKNPPECKTKKRLTLFLQNLWAGFLGQLPANIYSTWQNWWLNNGSRFNAIG